MIVSPFACPSYRFEQHYGTTIGKKKKDEKEEAPVAAPKTEEKKGEEKKEEKKEAKPASGKKSIHVQKKLKKRNAGHALDQHLREQFTAGRLYACISSRPGQCGRCDGTCEASLICSLVLLYDSLVFVLNETSEQLLPSIDSLFVYSSRHPVSCE